MDARRFDALSRALSAGSRRNLLGVLATLPVLGGLFVLEEDAAEAKDRRRRRKHRHKSRKQPGTRKKGCKPKGKGTVCAGKCGPVKSRQTCGKTVDCGPCNCTPPCCACFTCDAATQTYVSPCTASESCCDHDCADLQTDSAHCGTCGNACEPGEACCAGGCADLQTDVDHCGTCGNACGDDEICVEGECQPCNVICDGSVEGAAMTCKPPSTALRPLCSSVPVPTRVGSSSSAMSR